MNRTVVLAVRVTLTDPTKSVRGHAESGQGLGGLYIAFPLIYMYFGVMV